MTQTLGADRTAKLVSLAAIVLFLALAVYQAGKPLNLDAMDFPAVSEATAESGKPIYYRGEMNQQHSGLYHPPLYIYTQAAWFKVYGSGPTQARLFGATCALVLGWTTLLLAGCFLRREELAPLVPWFWALFLLNPYALQSSAVPDIDTSIYGPLLTLLLWSLVKLAWQGGVRLPPPPSIRGLGLVSLFFALCLWSKLTTVLAFGPFLCLLGAALWGWRRGLLATALSLLAGSGLFVVTYWTYGRLLGLDTSYSYAFLQQSFTRRGHLPSPFKNLLVMGSHLAEWAGLLPWLALIALVFGILGVAARRRDDRAWPVALVLLLHGAILSYYCARALTFGGAPFKYVFVSFGAVALASAYVLSRALSRGAAPARADGAQEARARRSVLPWAIPLILGFGAFAFYFGAHEVADQLIRKTWNSSTINALVVPPALALLAWIFLAFRARWARGTGLALALCAFALHLGFGLGVAFYQSDVSYSTTYDYGQQGLAATARFVRANTDPKDLITSMKDVGYLAERRYVENYSALMNDDEARLLIEYWDSGRVKLIVFTEGKGADDMKRNALLVDWVGRNAVPVARIGHYRVYAARTYRPRVTPRALDPHPAPKSAPAAL